MPLLSASFLAAWPGLSDGLAQGRGHCTADYNTDSNFLCHVGIPGNETVF
jgi:hypothetical protein